MEILRDSSESKEIVHKLTEYKHTAGIRNIFDDRNYIKILNYYTKHPDGRDNAGTAVL